MSSPKLSYKKELFFKKTNDGPVITLNLNGFASGNNSTCNVIDIVGSCTYDPRSTNSFCNRIKSSSPLGLLYNSNSSISRSGSGSSSIHSPPLIQSPGVNDHSTIKQEQEFENKKQTILNWVCTGLSPQCLVISLDRTYCIKDVVIECYGKVNKLNIKLFNCSVTGSLSGATPVVLAPGMIECIRTME